MVQLTGLNTREPLLNSVEANSKVNSIKAKYPQYIIKTRKDLIENGLIRKLKMLRLLKVAIKSPVSLNLILAHLFKWPFLATVTINHIKAPKWKINVSWFHKQIHKAPRQHYLRWLALEAQVSKILWNKWTKS